MSLYLTFKNSFMCMCVLPVYMYVSALCVPGACGSQKGALDSLQLKLEMVVTNYMGFGI